MDLYTFNFWSKRNCIKTVEDFKTEAIDEKRNWQKWYALKINKQQQYVFWKESIFQLD